MVQKPKPATITVEVGEDQTFSYSLVDHHDWSIMFDNTLEIKTEEETIYYPLDSVRKWSVKAYRKKIAHFYPEEVDASGVKSEK